MSDLLTVSEVARRLRVEGVTVVRWIKRGALEAIQLPGSERPRYRIRREALEKALTSSTGAQ